MSINSSGQRAALRAAQSLGFRHALIVARECRYISTSDQASSLAKIICERFGLSRPEALHFICRFASY